MANLINLALEDDFNKRVNIEEIYNYISNEILINVRDVNIQNEKNEIICIYNKKYKDPIDLLFDYKSECKEEYKNSFNKSKKNIYEHILEIYANNKKIKFNYRYESDEIGLIEIKFKFSKLLTSIAFMLYNCESLKSTDLSSLNINNITDMSYMLSNCHNLETIDLSSLNINQNININGILNHCQFLKLIKLSAFNINNIIDVNRLFNYEYAFKLEEKNILKKILKENFILGKNLNIYVELSNIIRNSLDDSIYPINMDLINNNFDIFYC